MIFPPPFFRTPPFYNPKYSSYYNHYKYSKNSSNNLNSNTNNSKINQPNLTNNYNDYLELFGIKLYFDDILIICLLYFLYSQDVDDPYLFVALLLLLLS